MDLAIAISTFGALFGALYLGYRVGYARGRSVGYAAGFSHGKTRGRVHVAPSVLKTASEPRKESEEPAWMY